MRIALIGPTYPFRGGISHYTTLLFRHLKKRHDTIFISFRRQYPRIFFPGKSDIDPSENKLYETDAKPLIDSMNPLTWMNAARHVIQNKVDLFILPWWVSFWAPQFWTISFLIRLLSDTRILYLCHNLVEHESKCIDKILTRLALSTGDFFIVHSEEERRELLSIFPKAKVKRNSHPTYAVFNSKDFEGERIKVKYGLKGKIILFFGFVREYKGLRYLIEALPKVLAKIDVTVLVVGEFWEVKEKYLRLITDNEVQSNVIIVDKYVPNEEVGDYFSAADIVVQPYISATGSGVIQTAFGFNKPVIVTSVGSLPEVVQNGKTGFIVSPRDPRGLAKAILKFFEEHKSEDFIHNIKLEKHRFSWDNMVATIESFLE
jgi:glycosyltransferase involved in cell wall biosynthesis